MIYWAVMRITRWENCNVLGGLPLTGESEHNIGAMMVFDDEEAAKEFAKGAEILTIQTRKP